MENAAAFFSVVPESPFTVGTEQQTDVKPELLLATSRSEKHQCTRSVRVSPLTVSSYFYNHQGKLVLLHHSFNERYYRKMRIQKLDNFAVSTTI